MTIPALFHTKPSTQRAHWLFALLLALATALTLQPGAVLAQDAAAASAVNINAASAEQLADGLVGIGLSRAEEIIRHREAYGPFGTVDELMEVRGIGQSTLDKNRTRITLD
ncbi:MAG: helix-hairpin-helix domain-containing protein [Pseudomonadota bacterium]